MDLEKNNNIINAFGTLIATLIAKKLNLDMTLYSVVFTISLFCMNTLFEYNVTQTISNFNLYYFLILIIISLMLLLIYFKYNQLYIKFSSIYNIEYNIIHITNWSVIHKFFAYTQYHKNFYDKISDIQFINDIYSKNTQRPQYDKKINFYDKNFNVSGYFVIFCQNDKDITNKEVKRVSEKLSIYVTKKSCNDVFEYIDNIQNKINELNNTSDRELSYIKIASNDGNLYKTYYIFANYLSENIKKIEDQYLNTFFHPQKYELYNLTKLVSKQPEFFIKHSSSPQVNLLLHGPPGTGKSNFAYRLANILGRNIISIDILSIGFKKELREIFFEPSICDEPIDLDKVIFILDEFDITVSTLYERELRFKTMENELFDLIQKKNMYKSIEKNNNDSVDSKIKNIADNINHHSDDDIIRLRDLLEILQGPVPLSKAIIIATTNKYDEILKMCPELFRPGRLTPYYFGYFDIPTINEVTNYHFNKTISFDKPVSKINICPAEIMLKIIEAKSNEQKGFTFFESFIKSVSI